MPDKQYGIIREQGEFMEPRLLNEEENKTVNNMDKYNSNNDSETKNN